MRVVNKSSKTRYSSLIRRDMQAGTKSAEVDAAGLIKAMTAIVKDCGSSLCLRFNDKERELLNKILALDAEGMAFKVVARPNPPNMLQLQMQEKAKEQKRMLAKIVAERDREEAINNEATYTSKKDVEQAGKKASNLRGEVAAKKLDPDKEEHSLADLMGNNKFIEESAKHSHISMVVASEEGWDMDKLNAPKADAPAADTPVAKDDAAPKQTEKPAKKTSKRKKESEQ